MVQHIARQAVGAIRAAVMARVSTAEQARGDKTSLEDQIAKGRAEVAKRGWVLHDTFTDVFRRSSPPTSRLTPLPRPVGCCSSSSAPSPSSSAP